MSLGSETGEKMRQSENEGRDGGRRKGGHAKHRTHVTKFLLEGIGVFHPLSLYFSFFFKLNVK